MVVPAEYDDYYTCWCGEVTLFNIINEKNDEYEYCSIDSSNQVVFFALFFVSVLYIDLFLIAVPVIFR